MRQSSPKVGVVILNWNGFDDTKGCVESLFNSTYSNFLTFVVDNNSSGNDVSKLKEKFGSEIQIIENAENLGYCGGNNIGFSEAKKKDCEYILILNNDTVIDKDCISELVKLLADNKKLVIAGATIMDYYDRTKIQCRGLTFSKWSGVSLALDLNKSYKKRSNIKPKIASGACFLIDSSFCEQLFDEQFFCYYDDTDLSLRALESGKEIIVSAKALVYHKGSVSANKIGGFTEFQLIRNRFLVIEKHSSLPQKIVFLFVTILLYTPFRLLVLLKNRKYQNIPHFFKGLSKGLLSFKFL